MPRLVDAEELIKKAKTSYRNVGPECSCEHGEGGEADSTKKVMCRFVCIKDIENAPTVEQRPTAHLEYHYKTPLKYIPRCTNCGEWSEKSTNYCHNCGAYIVV